MARKTKEEAEKTFHLLLETASRLFTTQGVASTTLNHIAEEAGLTRGAVYWHFKGKDDIIRALWETYSMPKIEPLKAKIFELEEGAALERFKQIIFELIDLIKSDHQVGQAFQIVMNNVESTENKSALQNFLNEEKAQFKNSLLHGFNAISKSHQLRGNLSSDTCAVGFLCFLHGMLGQHFCPQDKVDLGVHGRIFIEIYLNGIFAD